MDKLIKQIFEPFLAVLIEIRDLLKAGQNAPVAAAPATPAGTLAISPASPPLQQTTAAPIVATAPIAQAVAEGPTREAVGIALRDFAKSSPANHAAAIALLAKFGAADLNGVPKEKYAEFLKAINATQAAPVAESIFA